VRAFRFYSAIVRFVKNRKLSDVQDFYVVVQVTTIMILRRYDVRFVLLIKYHGKHKTKTTLHTVMYVTVYKNGA
jgi:hypothetical protein